MPPAALPLAALVAAAVAGAALASSASSPASPSKPSSARTAGFAVTFCDGVEDASRRGLAEQPGAQLERFEEFAINRGSVDLLWRPDEARACGRNVTSYSIEARASNRLLDWALTRLGGFPQDLCAADSVIMGGVTTDGTERPNSCGPYPPMPQCRARLRESRFDVPWALRHILSWNFELSVRGVGSVAGADGGPDEAVDMWCIHFSKAPPGPPSEEL